MNKFQIIKKMVGAPVIALALMLFAAGCEDSHPDNISSSEDIVAVSAAQQVYPLTIRATKDAWKAASDVEWIQLSRMEAIGTRDIELIIAENTSDALRTGHITVMISDNVKQVITVKQAGKGDTDVRVTPQLITAGAYSDTYSFTLEVKDKLASSANIATEVKYLVGADWIKNLNYTDAELPDGHLSRTYTFTLEDNEMADAREAAVNLIVKYGHSVYERTVKIYQNGLGTPAVATVENIYVRHNQTAHKQTIWLNDGDDSNVTYQVYRTSSQSGNQDTDPAEAWIADAQIVGSELVLTFKENTTDEIREGDIYIIASRGKYNDYASTAKLRVHVTQSAHQSAGISMPVGEVAHNYKGDTYTMPVQPVNNSKVSASVPADVNWITLVAVNNNNELTYTLGEYKGGQTGNFREATVTLTADNGNANKAVYYMKVRQYAPEMPGISMPVTKFAYTCEPGKKIIDLQPINEATIVRLTNDSPSDWLTNAVITDNNTLTFDLAAFQGNGSREVVIPVKASNAHSNSAIYYITIVQYGAEKPSADVPQYIGLGYNKQDGYFIPIYAITGTTVTVVSAPSWTGIQTNADVTNGITCDIEENTTANGGDGNIADYFREGVITLKATNAAHQDAVQYYISIRQYGRNLAYLTPAVKDYYATTYWNGYLGAQSYFCNADGLGFTASASSAHSVYMYNTPGGAVISKPQLQAGTQGGCYSTYGVTAVDFALAQGVLTSTVSVTSPSFGGCSGGHRLHVGYLWVNVDAAPYMQKLTQTINFHRVMNPDGIQVPGTVWLTDVNEHYVLDFSGYGSNHKVKVEVVETVPATCSAGGHSMAVASTLSAVPSDLAYNNRLEVGLNSGGLDCNNTTGEDAGNLGTIKIKLTDVSHNVVIWTGEVKLGIK